MVRAPRIFSSLLVKDAVEAGRGEELHEYENNEELFDNYQWRGGKLDQFSL